MKLTPHPPPRDTDHAGGPTPGPAGAEERLGPWVLMERLGTGGRAEVYRARPAAGGGPEVALKRPLEPGARAAERLLREGRATAAVMSPNVVRVIGVHTEGPRPYLVLELIHGLDLAELIRWARERGQPLPTEVVCAALVGMARGLKDAHEARDPETGARTPIFHGDIKPSNVLLGLDGQLRLADFGAAYGAGWLPPEDSDVTLGTLGYVAPERIGPERQTTPDPRADLFALGAVAFELCTLRPLFEGSRAERLQQHLQPEAYLRARILALPPHVQPRLAHLIGQLLAVDPAARPASAQAVVRILDRIQVELDLSIDIRDLVQGVGAQVTQGGKERRITQELPGGPPRPEAEGEGPRLRPWRPITDLSADTLREGSLAPADLMGPRALRRALGEERRQLWGKAALVCAFALAILVALWATTPTTVAISTAPEGAMISAQPGCEGPFHALQPAPFPFHHDGPWPLCLRADAKGYVPAHQRVSHPGLHRRATTVGVVLEEAACARVSSRPARLPIWIQNIPRGFSSVEGTLVCGLKPFEPYTIQLEYRGARWDVGEILPKAGETVDLFQDFSPDITSASSPFERCLRNARESNHERAIELCRLAAAQAASPKEKIMALATQAESWQALGQTGASCDLLYHALSVAVEARDLALEHRVQDLRRAQRCPATAPTREAQPLSDTALEFTLGDVPPGLTEAIETHRALQRRAALTPPDTAEGQDPAVEAAEEAP